jgi:hypothetical protein
VVETERKLLGSITTRIDGGFDSLKRAGLRQKTSSLIQGREFLAGYGKNHLSPAERQWPAHVEFTASTVR